MFTDSYCDSLLPRDESLLLRLSFPFEIKSRASVDESIDDDVDQNVDKDVG